MVGKGGKRKRLGKGKKQSERELEKENLLENTTLVNLEKKTSECIRRKGGGISN